ncbi:7TM GPCR protein, partial [Aphelenchoides avenae]
MSKRGFTILMLFVPFLASWPPAAHFYTWWPSTVATTRKYADLIDSSSCEDAGQMYISPLNEMLWANASPFVAVGTIVSAAYAVIVFCAYKVNRKVKSVKTWSASARDAHKQIHTALLCQAATPLMLDVLSVSMFIFASVGGLEQLHFVLAFATSCLAWIPVANPLSAIFFIKCYRTA